MQVQVAWVGLEESTPAATNMFISQVDSRGESVILTFGFTSPPILSGTPQQNAQTLRELPFVQARPVARVTVTRSLLKEVVAALQTSDTQLEQVERLRKSGGQSG